MLLEILKYPDARLKRKATPVENFDENLHKFLDDMRETMDHAGGIGLAAMQVNDLRDAVIIKIPKDYERLTDHEIDEIEEKSHADPKDSDIWGGEQLFLEIINPIVREKSGELWWKEGCLSVPGFFENVKRSRHLVCEYKNRHGESQSIAATGLLAVVIQHEMDHQNGVLFIDRISIMKRKKFEKMLKNPRRS